MFTRTWDWMKKLRDIWPFFTIFLKVPFSYNDEICRQDYIDAEWTCITLFCMVRSMAVTVQWRAMQVQCQGLRVLCSGFYSRVVGGTYHDSHALGSKVCEFQLLKWDQIHSIFQKYTSSFTSHVARLSFQKLSVTLSY